MDHSLQRYTHSFSVKVIFCEVLNGSLQISDRKTLQYLNFIKDWNKARNDVVSNLVEEKSGKLGFQIWACPWFSMVSSNLRFL